MTSRGTSGQEDEARRAEPAHAEYACIPPIESVSAFRALPADKQSMIDYLSIAVGLFCAAFFVRGAQLDEKSPFLWGALSIGAWIVAWLVWGGLIAGLASQGLLFAGLTLVKDRQDAARERSRG